MQAKRRMAAQRERELRNYHQEQQYHKREWSGVLVLLDKMTNCTSDAAGPKSDRSMSPNAGMTEEERRELIARQHRALYGNDSTLYSEQTSRPSSQDARNASAMGGRGNSPLAFDPFGMQGQNNSGEPAVQMPQRDHGNQNKDNAQQSGDANSNSSPSSNPTTNFSLFENAQQSSRTSNSSPGGSPPRQGKSTSAASVAPIGTRPTSGQAAGQGLQKRSTTPLPSPLSYGFSANDQSNNERSTSASSNPSSSVADKTVSGLGWGSNSAVWGNSNSKLGVQASVWG
jgi:hypothetical protein